MKRKGAFGKKLNILLSVVALILVVAVGGVITYSWVEQNTTLDIQMKGDIQRVPGNNGKVYNHQVTLDKNTSSTVDLKGFVDKVDEMVLSPVSSADGKSFYMQKSVGDGGSTYRKGTNSDANVSYISFDFDVTSITEDTKLYFEDGEDINGNADLTNHPKPSFLFGSSTTEANCVRVAVQVDNGTPLVFSQTGTSYTPLNSSTAVTPKKFEDYEFGKNPICSLTQNKSTKIRITIWIEETDSNFATEYVGSALNMKLMLTTPWTKSGKVTFIDKTADSFITKGLSNGGTLKVNGTAMSGSNGSYTARVTSSDTYTFVFTYNGTSYTWSAGAMPTTSTTYNAFDYGATNVSAYGLWGTVETESINIIDCLVGTSLETGTSTALDTHILVSTDGSHYYRACYDTTNKKWTVNIDKNYTTLYIQYKESAGATLKYKWNASSGRNKIQTSTYYLIGIEGGTTNNSSGSWNDTYNVYFYDGTVDTITSDCTKITYVAYSGSTKVTSGNMLEIANCYQTPITMLYTNKIDRFVFTVVRTRSDGGNIEYVWDGTGKVNSDIYYTATSYTEDNS